MHPIPDILADLRAGKMIVLVDDEKRENEGDLVCAAELVTPQIVNFMISEGRGMLCVPLSGEICDRLDLTPQSAVNTTQRGTAYTISVDAHERFGITTGVSATDRAATIRVLADPAAKPADLARPGHVQPLRARDGGVLVRAGQTEGSVDLCKLASLKPAAAIIEVMNEDGTMARLPELQKLCARHDIKLCSVADVIQHRLRREKLVHRIDTVPFESEAGRFTLHAYRSVVDPFPHVALTCGGVGELDETSGGTSGEFSGGGREIKEPVLVRMHSQNLLGDVFGDAQQPSGKTLRASLRMIQEAGRGALVYLRHEGMGTGLLKRLQTLHYPSAPGSPGSAAESDEHAHVAQSRGDYGIGSQILRDLGIRKLRLITNHPFHPTALEGFGLEISEFVKVRE